MSEQFEDPKIFENDGKPKGLRREKKFEIKLTFAKVVRFVVPQTVNIILISLVQK